MNITDGCGVYRCEFCHTPIKDAADYPLVTLRQEDVEAIMCLLVEYVDCPEVWDETITRLEHALGHTYEQYKAAAAEKRAQVPLD